MIVYTSMHSQFTREFVRVICLFYNDNVIITRKGRRAKKSFEIFIKHTSLISLDVILKEINLFSNHLKSSLESLVNHLHYSFSLFIHERLFCLIENSLV